MLATVIDASPVAIVCSDLDRRIFLWNRSAEEIFLGHITTGAGNDIERATEIARNMVCEWGMSELGPLAFGKKDEAIFLGREINQHRDYSEDTAIQIDKEVRRIVSTGYERAKTILANNKEVLERIARTSRAEPPRQPRQTEDHTPRCAGVVGDRSEQVRARRPGVLT